MQMAVLYSYSAMYCITSIELFAVHLAPCTLLSLMLLLQQQTQPCGDTSVIRMQQCNQTYTDISYAASLGTQHAGTHSLQQTAGTCADSQM
jgi:hypothetical protein